MTVLLITGSAQAQQPKKISLIRYLSQVDPAPESTRSEAFRQGRRELGSVEGQNIASSLI
jgi:hypothetical protein